MQLKRQVNLKYRDLNIEYNVDMMSVDQMARKYEISWRDMKQALRNYGFTIRKNEPEPTEPMKEYLVNLVDSVKVIIKEKNNVVVS